MVVSVEPPKRLLGDLMSGKDDGSPPPRNLPPSFASDQQWLPSFLVAASPELGIEIAYCQRKTPQTLATGVERPAMHAQRLRLSSEGSVYAENDGVAAPTHDHHRTGLALIKRGINRAKIHPPNFCVDPDEW
jgi:hypothetical protein